MKEISATRAILVHGLGRTPLSMYLLSARLKKHGIRSKLFSYVTSMESFDRISNRLVRHMIQIADHDYFCIGHSLGGLLLRAAISKLPPETPRPGRLFLLGTPNQSPRLARRLRNLGPYRLLTGDCGQLLAKPDRMNSLPSIDVPITIFAGVKGVKGRLSPFGNEENDGIVSISEAYLDDRTEIIRLPTIHTFMMANREAFRVILEKIRNSNLES